MLVWVTFSSVGRLCLRRSDVGLSFRRSLEFESLFFPVFCDIYGWIMVNFGTGSSVNNPEFRSRILDKHEVLWCGFIEFRIYLYNRCQDISINVVEGAGIYAWGDPNQEHFLFVSRLAAVIANFNMSVYPAWSTGHPCLRPHQQCRQSTFLSHHTPLLAQSTIKWHSRPPVSSSECLPPCIRVTFTHRSNSDHVWVSKSVWRED